MLTPAFEIKQCERFITVIIHARFAKVAETEIFILDEEFKFYSKPYFLRLNLPGKLVEDGRETAKYDVETGIFTVEIPKQTAGEHFAGLDMITKLLAPKGSTVTKAPLIEVLDSTDGASALSDNKVADNDDDDDEFDEDFDWQIDQIPYTQSEDATLCGGCRYGFANLRSGVFLRLQDELQGVIDLSDPDKTPSSERTVRRQQEEEEKFDEDHYLADLYDDDAIQEILSFEPDSTDEYKRLKNGENPDKLVTLSEEDRQKMKDLPNKEYLLDKDQQSSLLLGLVDIIYAYAYDHRTTEGEGNVESAWTIRKLSATLSWLENFTSLKMVVHSCMRRALSYPLYRHWRLSKKVLKDTIHLFSLGRRRLLKCLLEIHTCLNLSDPYYILNDLYITDYCIWLQGISEKRLASLARSLAKIKIEKCNIGLELVEIEQAAELAQVEDEEEAELMSQMSTVNLGLEHKSTLAEESVELDKNKEFLSGEESVCERLHNLAIVDGKLGGTQGGAVRYDSKDSQLITPVDNSLGDERHGCDSKSCSEISDYSKFKKLVAVVSGEQGVIADVEEEGSLDSDDETSDDESCSESSSSCSDTGSDTESDDNSSAEEHCSDKSLLINVGTGRENCTASFGQNEIKLITEIDNSNDRNCEKT